MKKGQIEYITPSLLTPHPDALGVFEQTRVFRFQVNTSVLQPTPFGHSSYELPFVIAGKNGNYQFFAGWKCLLAPFSDGFDEQKLPVLVFPSRDVARRISLLAWHYAFSLVLSNLHEDFYLAHTAHLYRQCPVNEEIFKSLPSNKHSLKAHLVTEMAYAVNRRRVERQEEQLSRHHGLEINDEND